MFIGMGVRIGLRSSAAAFSPSSLFAASEPGVWYDPSDLTTLFQDTAGTTPVTAAGQSVARINDKSGRGNHATQATAASRPTYQVDGNGKAYLSFDGVDDFLVTPTITPGIDKVQVFAGVRKLSDPVNGGTIVESSSEWFTKNGSFSLGGSSSGNPNYYLCCRGNFGGTNGPFQIYSTYTAPITNVIFSKLDLTQTTFDTLFNVRINGAIPSTVTNGGSNILTGTGGNFLAYPLYIGRRGGVNVAFNGRIYSLITRFGANLTAQQISDTETWVNGKTGAY